MTLKKQYLLESFNIDTHRDRVEFLWFGHGNIYHYSDIQDAINLRPAGGVVALPLGITYSQLTDNDYEYDVLPNGDVRYTAPIHKAPAIKDRIDGHKYTHYFTNRALKDLYKSKPDSNPIKKEAFFHAAVSEDIHRVVDAFTVKQSVLANNSPETFDAHIEALANASANCFYTRKSNGKFGVANKYGTVDLAEAARVKFHLRLAADAAKETPVLTHDITAEAMIAAFITPLPVIYTATAASINDRSGTEITLVEGSKARVKSVAYAWEQKVGRIWSPIEDATSATYTPTVAGEFRCAITITDVDGIVVDEVFHTNSRVITEG